MELELTSVERQGAHETGGRPPSWARPPISWAHWTSTDLNSNSIYSRSGRKNQREGFIMFYDTGAAAKPCSSLGGLIWSLFGAPERGIRRHRHHQPSSITNFMMLTAVHE